MPSTIMVRVETFDAPSSADLVAGLVNERWRAREAPYGGFIVFADGSLSVRELMRSSPHDRLHDPRAEEWYWQEILRATAWTAVDWLDVDGMFASCAYAGSRAMAGESGAHGSIGWVALTRDDDESTLEWLAVSCYANPFSEVTLDATAVTATSTAGRIWTFPRHAPQQVKITEDPAYPWPRR
ncbi:hypothetical protein AB0D04_01550 [Streptomyces sp. NPDC048483]|uniref:hypothetical protein n=1 Tax=Streptomyces sp. NPDC048483 TaxID=3154927 RepID=UPI003428081D